MIQLRVFVSHFDWVSAALLTCGMTVAEKYNAGMVRLKRGFWTCQ